MAVLFRRAPASLVIEHEEDVAFFFRIYIIQSLVHVTELKEALRHKVVFDALVLEVMVHDFNEIQIGKCEAVQLVGCFVLVKGDDERTVESIVAKKLKFLRIVVPSQCLLRAFHIENMKEKL